MVPFEHYFIIIRKGISIHEVQHLATLISMHNSQVHWGYLEIWAADDEQIRKLTELLDVLDVEYRVAKDYTL